MKLDIKNFNDFSNRTCKLSDMKTTFIQSLSMRLMLLQSKSTTQLLQYVHMVHSDHTYLES